MANKDVKKVQTENIFQKSVEATEDIAQGYCIGLQALKKKDSVAVYAKDNRKITGSVDIDKETKRLYPEASRWDYVVGYEDKAYFLEVHSANAGEVKTVIRKKEWLLLWLKNNAATLRAIKADGPYYWAPSGENTIIPTSPQFKKMAQHQIKLVNKLNLG